MKLCVTLFLVLLIVPQKRIINTHDFDYEFYISSEKIKKPKVEKTYFWYKSGEIHQSTGDIGGAVLVNAYIKYYKSKQLAEKGVFDKGLKDGVWKNWHKNGSLSKIEKWKKGFRHGDFIIYTENGKKKVEGKYRNHKKHGAWIDYVSQDTLVYKKGILVPKKQKDTIKREPFLKRIFKKKKKKAKKEDPKKKKSNAKKT
ncbi:toxin-antitoxin system YwqK family antitoxin [Kordia sp.]|uniref:toxin-antitoxin system YwqK family antitoxin n=1 Tax=Kordia sp. TaxID=1965332 RepID=UPI003D6C5378